MTASVCKILALWIVLCIMQTAWANDFYIDSLKDGLSDSRLDAYAVLQLWQMPEQLDQATIEALRLMEPPIFASQNNQTHSSPYKGIYKKRSTQSDLELIKIHSEERSLAESREIWQDQTQKVLSDARLRAYQLHLDTTQRVALHERSLSFKRQLLDSLEHGIRLGLYSLGYHLGQNAADELWGKSEDDDHDIIWTPPNQDQVEFRY
jgi:hypothetical protein